MIRAFLIFGDRYEIGIKPVQNRYESGNDFSSSIWQNIAVATKKYF